MAKNTKKGLSVEELKVLQAKVASGEKLTPEEEDQLLDAELEAEKAAEASKEEEQIERIASVIAKKLQSGTVVDGGRPVGPPSEEQIAKHKARTKQDVADEYFAGHKDFPWPGIHVSDDLQIFLGNVVGENARDNHIAANPGMKFESFKKPE